eukprot:1186790-Prorocentrum_minimum.AAC.2
MFPWRHATALPADDAINAHADDAVNAHANKSLQIIYIDAAAGRLSEQMLNVPSERRHASW